MANELVAIINPKKRRKRRKSTKRKTTKRSRRNPGMVSVSGTSNPKKRRRSRKRTYKRRRARRNPAGKFKIGIESIAFTAGGAIASKAIPSMLPVVRDYNKGVIGWGIQGATGFIISFILGSLLKMKKASQFVLLGTGVNVITTALDELVFKRMVDVGGLGFYPNEQLAAYQLEPGTEIDADYDVVEAADGLQLAGYEEVPLDESLGGLGARGFRSMAVSARRPAMAVSARRPAVRPRARAMSIPAARAAVCSSAGDRFVSRF